ncbi:MAG: GMC family oxidoreductase N-terminal domain-containing protein, partial [Cyanobacteria bacterium P01_F01_bin.3]
MQGTDTNREPSQTKPQPDNLDLYDIIIIGSGNGACGFLSRYLDSIESSSSPPRILVLEEGESFFQTSDITHQNNWTQAYAEANIFKLHNALTPTGKPIISGRACTMGGGGSINYTMLHESSQWLSHQIGHTPDYWDQLKADLNEKFHRPDPTKEVSPITQWILNAAKQFGYQQNQDYTKHIPNFKIGQTGLLHVFPTQFNRFGQRTNSGVSLVDWVNGAVEIKTRHHVERLEFVTAQEGDMSCVGVHAQDLDRGASNYFQLKPDGGKLILCAGAGSPKLLWPYRETLGRGKIGQHVNDHVLLPLGIYVVPPEIAITGKDVYIPIFATNLWEPSSEEAGQGTVFNLDFFSGNFERLWFIVAHLYLAFLLPNWLKKIVIRTPWLFTFISNAIRLLLEFINVL